jgi:uncharacterized protein (DUF1778 family)
MTTKRTGRAVNFRLDPALAGLVEAAARAEGCTLAEWWTRAARQRIEYHAEVMRALRAAHAAPSGET